MKYFASRSRRCQNWRGLRKQWNCCVGIEQTQKGDKNIEQTQKGDKNIEETQKGDNNLDDDDDDYGDEVRGSNDIEETQKGNRVLQFSLGP